MSLQIRMFGPLTDKKKELHNLLTGLGYPIFMDFINRENRQWREDNKAGSFFYYIDGNGTDDWLWVCGDEDPDLQVTPSADLLGDGADRLLEWLERLLDGNVKIYDQAPPPLTQILELPVFDIDQGSKEYALENILVNDCMFYQVTKPFVDRPYTTVVRGFGRNGHKRFFTNLFVCASWGVSKRDIQFLHKAWEYFEMEGVLDLEVLMKEATEACRYPGLETEPEVWRTDLNSVLEIFNKRAGFYSFIRLIFRQSTIRNNYLSLYLCSTGNTI